MIIAATHSDEVNMVTCQVAHSVFGIPRKIARLRAQNYLDAIYSDLFQTKNLPIDVVISPETEVAEAALQRLAAPATFDTESFMGGKAQLLGIALDEDCPVLEHAPAPVDRTCSRPCAPSSSACAARSGSSRPTRTTSFSPATRSTSSPITEDVNRTLEIFGKTTKKQERVVIVGGGNVGLAVARALEARTERVRVKIIERDRACAEHAADTLSRTIVLNGDGMDIEILMEANIDRADAVLVVTDDDKTNLLVAVRAKSAGCPMAIALVNDPTLVPLMGPLDIDAYINPRATTVSSILRHVRHGRVRAIYSIGDAEAEVIEAQVLSTSPLAGRLIRDIEFPEGVLVGAVLQRRQGAEADRRRCGSTRAT